MTIPLIDLTYHIDDIANAVTQFWQTAAPYNIMAFDAEMGAGKTTFIRELCEYLGVTDNVSSPTFAIINEYQFKINGIDSKIYHMDWYRLRNEADAINTGVEDTLLSSLSQNAYSFIEWPSIAATLLPKPYLNVNIGIIDAATRRLSASVIH